MKNAKFLAALAAILLAAAVLVSAQTRLDPMIRPRRQSAQEFYTAHPAYSINARGAGVSAPDTHFLAYLYTGKQAFEVGDTMVPRLIFVQGTIGLAINAQIYGQVLLPGDNGYYDGSVQPLYFEPDNGSWGFYKGGFGGFELVTLLSYQFNRYGNQKYGEYVVEVSIVDAEGGRLLQQPLVSRVFLNRTGPSGKGLHFVSGVQTFPINETTSSAKLLGNLPPNRVVHTFVGNPWYWWQQGPVTTNQDGELVFVVDAVVGPDYNGPQHPADVVLCFEDGECQTIPNMFWFSDKPRTR